MSLVSIPELEPESNSWVVSYKNGDIAGEWSDENIVSKFTKEECFVETAKRFLSKADERIYNKQQKIKKLKEIRDNLLSTNPNLKEYYDNLYKTQLFCYQKVVE